MLMVPGMRKYKLIENTFAIKMMQTMGPSIASMSTNHKILSIIPKSFENLLLSRPVEVISK